MCQSLGIESRELVNDRVEVEVNNKGISIELTPELVREAFRCDGLSELLVNSHNASLEQNHRDG